MIMSSFQYNLEDVIESSLKFKFNVLAIDKLTSSPKTKGRRTVLTQKTLSLKLST